MNSRANALPAPEQKRAAVREMFDRIARRYDLMNRLLTGGLDARWRKQALAAANCGPGDLVLDLACGTGDLSLLAAARGARAVGLDFAREMLRVAARRGAQNPRAVLVQGDAEALPFADASFDVVVSGFALRNFARLQQAFAELARVLRPGGRFALLDVARPQPRALAAAHALYFDRAVPLIGAALSDRRAYRYLPQSTVYLPNSAELQAMLTARGLCNLRRRAFLFGAVQLWCGRKARA